MTSADPAKVSLLVFVHAGLLVVLLVLCPALDHVVRDRGQLRGCQRENRQTEGKREATLGPVELGDPASGTSRQDEREERRGEHDPLHDDREDPDRSLPEPVAPGQDEQGGDGECHGRSHGFSGSDALDCRVRHAELPGCDEVVDAQERQHDGHHDEQNVGIDVVVGTVVGIDVGGVVGASRGRHGDLLVVGLGAGQTT